MANEELVLLSVQLGTFWESLARLLEVREAEIEEIHHDNETPRRKGFKMLMAWKQREGFLATYQVLHDALCHPLVQRQDLAERFCIDAGPFLVST